MTDIYLHKRITINPQKQRQAMQKQIQNKSLNTKWKTYNILVLLRYVDEDVLADHATKTKSPHYKILLKQ